jgi:hypothetical protein
MKTINSLRVLKYLEQGDSWFLIFFWKYPESMVLGKFKEPQNNTGKDP